MSFRYLAHTVAKWNKGNNKAFNEHYKDLKYTSLTLYNAIVNALNKHELNDLDFIDVVLNVSKTIEEATLTREKVGMLQQTYKDQLFYFYYVEGAEYPNLYRKPVPAKTFEAFRHKDNRVKDYAITIVGEMYYEDQKSKHDFHS